MATHGLDHLGDADDFPGGTINPLNLRRHGHHPETDRLWR
jgi:hypothetical protein